MGTRDYYEVLGVPRDASPGDIATWKRDIAELSGVRYTGFAAAGSKG